MWRNRTALRFCLLCFTQFVARAALGAGNTDISGNWFSADVNPSYWLVLQQNGANVTGVYTFQDGRVSGTFRDGILRLSWWQEANRRGGTTTLTLSQDQQLLSGSWQYDPRVYNSGLTGSGTWN